ncbi:MAG: Mrp/NBP35 family ATP-binding protein [Chitinophagaceae bacterium]|nr:Mrp/NBP35 family ATP-binding protein [Oligoflexus sp.]
MSLFKKVQSLFGSAPDVSSPAPQKPVASSDAETPVPGKKVEPQGGGLEGVRHIVAVGSGKGGVGKSTITLNLALALAAQGLKVGVLDADVYGPSQQHLTNAPRPELSGEDRLIPPEYEGVKIISVAMFSNVNQAQVLRGPMATQLLRQFLTQVNWGDLDYLLIDLPPGTGDIQLSLAQMAPLSGAVLITTPQEMSIIDVRKAVSMFKTLNVPMLGVIENMSYFICDSCDKKHYIFRKGGGARLAAELGLPLLAEIPLDPRVVETSDEGKAVMVSMPSSDAAREFTKAAKTISDGLALQQKSGDGGLGYFLLEWK